MATAGAVLSSLTVAAAPAEFPARSVAVPVTDSPPVSAVSVTGGVQPSTPERASAHWKRTVTSERFQPWPLAGGSDEATIDGAVRSRLTVTLALARFPARSIAVPLTT